MKLGYKCEHCKGIAFYLTHKVMLGEIIKSENAYFSDGSKPEPYTRIKCEKCKNLIENLFVENVLEL